MNDEKIKKLFELAREESAPLPPPDFAANVLRVVRQESSAKFSEPFSIFDQLNFLFTRFAFGAAAFIILCVAADFGLSATGLPDLSDGLSQISAQFLESF